MLHNKLPQNVWVKTMAIYVTNNFVDWQLGLSFAGQFWSWLGLATSLLGWLETVGWSQRGERVAVLHSFLAFQAGYPRRFLQQLGRDPTEGAECSRPV